MTAGGEHAGRGARDQTPRSASGPGRRADRPTSDRDLEDLLASIRFTVDHVLTYAAEADRTRSQDALERLLGVLAEAKRSALRELHEPGA